MGMKKDKKPALPKPDFAQNHTVEYSMWGWDYTRYNTLMKFVDDSFIYVYGYEEYDKIMALIVGLRTFSIELLALINSSSFDTEKEEINQILDECEEIALQNIDEAQIKSIYPNLRKAYQKLLTIKTDIGLSSRNVNKEVTRDIKTITKRIKVRVCS